MSNFMGWNIKFSNTSKTIFERKFPGRFGLSDGEHEIENLLKSIDPSGYHIVGMPVLYGFPNMWNSMYHRYNSGSTRLTRGMAKFRYDRETEKVRVIITR